MTAQEIKAEADKLIGQTVAIPIIGNNQINKEALIVESNYIANENLCLTYFKDTKFCCNANLILNI